MVSCFEVPFYILISTLKCEDNSLLQSNTTYAFFAQEVQEYNKLIKKNFLDIFFSERSSVFNLPTDLKLNSIRIINGNDMKTIKEWKNSDSEELISLYNKEIYSLIPPNLTNDGNKVQIKIKVNNEVEEFVYLEFEASGEYVKFSNCHFSTQNECYLDYFPNEDHSIDYQFYNQQLWSSIISIPLEKYETKKTLERENIKNLTIITSNPAEMFYDMEDFKKPNELKFTDFNLSMKQFEEFEDVIKTFKAGFGIQKQLTLFFEATKEISQIRLDVFAPALDADRKQIGTVKVSVEISKEGKVTRKEEIKSFSLVEIQKEENSLKVILGRPTDATNPIKAEESLSIKFMDITAHTKSTNITLKAKEKIDGDFTFTTFNVNKDKNKTKRANLYDAMTKDGLVSITLNGKNGMIGTYGVGVNVSRTYYYIYSDKLISIPFVEKEDLVQKDSEQNYVSKKLNSEFSVKKIVIFIVVVGLLIGVGIFVYFHTKKKENDLETF